MKLEEKKEKIAGKMKSDKSEALKKKDYHSELFRRMKHFHPKMSRNEYNKIVDEQDKLVRVAKMYD